MTVLATAGTRLCGVEDVGDEEILKVEIEGRGCLAVSRFNGQYFVSDDLCPHAEASLSEGYVEEGRIICPVHFAEFDLGSGDVHNPPAGCGRLRFYPVTIAEGAVFAGLD
jgi:3-phenylpropionate/trans-cinnamate dioxygenase ferredoxin component